ncbi:MAG: MBL fold metallo-hydrolase [Kofleriaceae bacterium]|nr:MBL fold metallo-hydrolase [Kofleriaceae bacterium]MBP9166868.1 MBL fold metallo-hydrolase [Kofleriaceae bacterium]MBP9859999.1 MBL fold metallo-hydrolase [Kofleriaceae bacterium]
MFVTRLSLTLSLLGAACGAAITPTAPPPAAVTVTPYAAASSDVNAYVISDGAGAIVIDATRTPEDGAAVARLVAERTTGPVTVLITHGHPDHFLGLGALRAALPEARFVVARPEIEADVIGMATWMTAQGWLAELPAMRPRSAADPEGFDYATELEVVDGGALTLPGGARLELTSDYPATEAEHMTTAYLPAVDALFTSDLAYHDVHLWLGVGVTRASAAAWRATLDRLRERWAAKPPTVYPGHGRPTDPSVFAANQAYLDDILAVTATAASEADATAAMVDKHPAHANRDFLLKMSISNLWAQR